MLSVRGLCVECGPRRQREAILQLVAHDGPWFDYWRRRCAAAYGAVIPGEAPVPAGRFVPVVLDENGYPT